MFDAEATENPEPNCVLAEDEFDPRELYPLITKSAAAAGWDDPAMDVYDKYAREE